MHVLMDLAAIGGKQPIPEGLAFARSLVAMALVRQEIRHVPVVCWCSSNQCNEDGFCGHIELEVNTQNQTLQTGT